MIYSVWNYRERRYDYYEGGGVTGTHAGTPPSPVMSSPMGLTPEQAAWPLPVGARKVGSGGAARGRIASLGDSDSPFPELVVPMAIGIAAYYYFTRKS